jgi:hypothetical protein
MRNGFAMQKNARGVRDAICKVHAVSLTLHAKYDTACMMDESFGPATL